MIAPSAVTLKPFILSEPTGISRTFQVPADPDAILDSLTEEEYARDQLLPYWTEHWPSSEVMFGFLASLSFAAGEHVLEIGSGLGVLSALLCSRGMHVTASDISAAGCTLARRNIDTHAAGNPFDVICFDWRRSPLKRRWKHLVASDVLYEQRWIKPVCRFLCDHLHADGTAWIADPCRSHWKAFKAECRARGLQYETVVCTQVNDGKTDVEIIRITWS